MLDQKYADTRTVVDFKRSDTPVIYSAFSKHKHPSWTYTPTPPVLPQCLILYSCDSYILAVLSLKPRLHQSIASNLQMLQKTRIQLPIGKQNPPPLGGLEAD